MTETLRAKVNTEEVGKRIDRFLADSWPDISRARITNLIVEGHVSRENNSTVFRPSDKTREDDIFVATLPSPTAADPLAEAIDLNVVYEDQDVIVIDKPAGMTVHPAPGQQTGTLVNALLAYCGDSLSGIGGVKRPGIVHRIDKDTSGLLVVAKTDIAHQGLAKQFHEHSVERAYIPYVQCLTSQTNNTIETTIIDQLNKFLINSFEFEFELIKLGRIRIKTAIKNKAGIICSNPINYYSKNF